MSDKVIYTGSCGVAVSYETINEAFDKECTAKGYKTFPMELAGKGEVAAVIAAVNMGIDAHLEACYCPERGDNYGDFQRTLEADKDTKYWKKGDTLVLASGLSCEVSKESLPVLLRRLSNCEFPDPEVDPDDCEGEDIYDDATSLVGSILTCLGIDDYSGKYEGRDD